MKKFYCPLRDTEIEYEQVIYGEIHGVLFCRRRKDDPHVCIHIISEDDGHWFISSSGVNCSAVWLDELISTLEMAKAWLNGSPKVKKVDHGWEFIKPKTSYEVGGDGELVPH